MTRVLFVCLGNICRSPTAHAVFEALVAAEGLQHKIEVDSSGTGDWHIGHPPDKRASAAAAQRGVDMSTLRARQFCAEDFTHYDYILAMDASNLADIQALAPSVHKATVKLFLDYASEFKECEVPDPYYGGDAGFEHVLDMVEDASKGLLSAIRGLDNGAERKAER
ncbi:MAG: protein-tyrosine phosphatase [Bermanella sp.]